MRIRSTGILNYLEKKWISQQIYSHSNYLQSNKFQPVEYMHTFEYIRLIIVFFFIIVIINVLIHIFKSVFVKTNWYKLQHARKFEKRIVIRYYWAYVLNNLNVII